VSVFLPDRFRWDAWHNAEKDNLTKEPFVANSDETIALYALRESDLSFCQMLCMRASGGDSLSALL
jgi:hypothetical protein